MNQTTNDKVQLYLTLADSIILANKGYNDPSNDKNMREKWLGKKLKLKLNEVEAQMGAVKLLVEESDKIIGDLKSINEELTEALEDARADYEKFRLIFNTIGKVIGELITQGASKLIPI
jgi:hypothetical protein